MCEVCEIETVDGIKTVVVAETVEMTNEERTLAVFDEMAGYDTVSDSLVSCIEMLASKFENGFYINDTGAFIEIGFTGAHKTVKWSRVFDVLRLSPTNTGQAIVERLFNLCPVEWSVAFGDGIHDIFEGYRPGSCMSGDDCRNLREIYACNPDDVGIVYHAGNDPLLCSAQSALFWIGKRCVYLDRHYSSGSLNKWHEIESMARHLQAEYGMPVVSLYHSTDKLKRTEKIVTFKLELSGHPLPYIDSLCYIKKYDHQHVWLTNDSSKSYRCAQSTQGTWPDGSSIEHYTCCSCGCDLDEDDVRTDNAGNSYCDSCYSESFSHCQWCEEDYPIDDVNSVEVYCVYGPSRQPRWRTLDISDDSLSSDFTPLESDSDRYVQDRYVIRNNRDEVVDPDVDNGEYAITEDGEVYHPDDVVELASGEIHPQDDCVEVDGLWYLSGDEPTDDDADNTATTETTVETPTVQQEELPLIPDGYRLAVPDEMLPVGSHFLQVASDDCPACWCESSECGVSYGCTSLELRVPYIVPVTSTETTEAGET